LLGWKSKARAIAFNGALIALIAVVLAKAIFPDFFHGVGDGLK